MGGLLAGSVPQSPFMFHMPVSWYPVTAWVCGCRGDRPFSNPRERPKRHRGQVPALQLGLWPQCGLELPGDHVYGEQWTGPENL